MADEYPFMPYPFSEPVMPEQPAQPVQPMVSPFSSLPVTDFSASTSESPSAFSEADDDEDEAAKKTALAIIAGVLVVLLLAGFGVWYFLLRDKKEGEIPPPPPPQEESDANLIVAAFGGKILTPEGASLLIPPGALSQDTRLEISKVSDGDVTDLFELKPLGVKFLKPVIVEIPYKKSGPIILEYWREEDEKKRALKYTVDRKEKKLKTQVKEF